MKDAQTRLRYFAGQVAKLRQAPAVSKSFLAAVKQYQRDRLARTHADLLQSDRYRLAARFFLDEIYGTKDFSSRDAELARMIPTMSRLLPASALAVLADAVELDALSEQLDLAVAAAFQAECGSGQSTAPPLAEECYFRLYRAAGHAESRIRQIELIEDIGRELDRLLGKPFLYRILKGMEGPARLAGLGQMQVFLLRGFEAFRAMNGADHFIGTIVSRERALMEQILAGVAAADGVLTTDPAHPAPVPG
ncbi:MAG: hypothetical protein ABIP08_12840 [Lautropia sp.]